MGVEEVRGGMGHRGGRRDGVNTPAYTDWANIQFVPPRLSSTVAATQFLPIDLPATGTIAPGDATSPEYGAASQRESEPAGSSALGGGDSEGRQGLNPRRGAEMRRIRERGGGRHVEVKE